MCLTIVMIRGTDLETKTNNNTEQTRYINTNSQFGEEGEPSHWKIVFNKTSHVGVVVVVVEGVGFNGFVVNNNNSKHTLRDLTTKKKHYI